MSTVIKCENPIAALLQDQNDGDIPYDVTFRIIENDVATSEKLCEVAGVATTCRFIGAHKLVLASGSPVFKAMFYGPIKESRDLIPIEQTTIEAFQKMREFLYQIEIDCKKMTLTEIIELIYLADRYEITELKEELKKQLAIFPVTKDNLVDTASVAYELSWQLDSVSSVLLLNCAKFFQKSYRRAADVTKFVSEHHGNEKGNLVMELLSLVSTLPPLECGNCGENPCLSGQPVIHQKLREGLMVTNNMDAPFMGDEIDLEWENFSVTVLSNGGYSGLVKLRFDSGSGPVYVREIQSCIEGAPRLEYYCVS